MDLDNAPTLNSLNKPQKRALIMRDQLRYEAQHHLDEFIEGIAFIEPPAYKRINGTIYPALTMVSLKDAATCFHLGNVHFENDIVLPNGIYRAYLTFENGRFEIRTEDALPADEDNLDSVPIHVFIAKNMVPMFATKFKAIYARMKQINEIRQAAFNAASNPVEQFKEGKSLARFDTHRLTREGSSALVKTLKKRRPGAAVIKHAANKRSRIGLDTIAQSAKIATFDTIPEKIKIDLFDNVVRTALPNFDNLMIASWNVVSVYSNVGTDFPELHKSIVELKSVLQDFEEGFGSNLSRREPIVRRDFASPSHNGVNAADSANGFDGAGARTGRLAIQITPEANQDGASDAAPAPLDDGDSKLQLNDDMGGSSNENEPEQETTVTEAQKGEIRPPSPLNLMQMIQRHNDTGDMDDDDDYKNDNDNDDSERQSESHASSKASHCNSVHRSPSIRRPTESPLFEREHQSPDSNNHPLPPKSKPKPRPRRSLLPTPTPAPQTTDPEAVSAPSSRPTTPLKKSLTQMSTADLRLAYKTRKAELIATFDGNSNVPQQYRVQMQKMMAEIRAREAREWEQEGNANSSGGGGGGGGGESAAAGGFLGRSVLGGRKGGIGGAIGGGRKRE